MSTSVDTPPALVAYWLRSPKTLFLNFVPFCSLPLLSIYYLHTDSMKFLLQALLAWSFYQVDSRFEVPKIFPVSFILCPARDSCGPPTVFGR